MLNSGIQRACSVGASACWPPWPIWRRTTAARETVQARALFSETLGIAKRALGPEPIHSRPFRFGVRHQQTEQIRPVETMPHKHLTGRRRAGPGTPEYH
jgi:hypothetical protein